jgi:dephospho-CoA kinase
MEFQEGSQPFVLGLTGSIGMGKSTVCGFFRSRNVPVLDSDEVRAAKVDQRSIDICAWVYATDAWDVQVVHRLYSQGGAAVGPVGELFPSAVVDGGKEEARRGPQH